MPDLLATLARKTELQGEGAALLGASDNGNSMTAEQNARFDEITAEISSLNSEITSVALANSVAASAPARPTATQVRAAMNDAVEAVNAVFNPPKKPAKDDPSAAADVHGWGDLCVGVNAEFGVR